MLKRKEKYTELFPLRCLCNGCHRIRFSVNINIPAFFYIQNVNPCNKELSLSGDQIREFGNSLISNKEVKECGKSLQEDLR